MDSKELGECEMTMSTIRIDDQHQCNNPSHGITCMADMTACMGAMQAHKYNSTALMMQMSLGDGSRRACRTFNTPSGGVCA